MTTNYPPGVTGAIYGQSVYKYSCESHGTSYGHGYRELGGFFLQEDAVVLCDEADKGQWVQVRAAQCEKHGRWTENDKLNVERKGYVIETVWECVQHHFFITEQT